MVLASPCALACSPLAVSGVIRVEFLSFPKSYPIGTLSL
jgi:hypothetical protein